MACGSSNPEAWKVPTTWRYLSPDGTTVTEVLFENETAPNLEGVRNTAVGVRTVENETLLSLTVGQSMVLMHDAPVERGDLDVLGMTDQWNGLGVAVTIAGHDTRDCSDGASGSSSLAMPIQMPWLVGEPLAAVGTVVQRTSFAPMTGPPPLRRTRKPAPR